MSQLPEFVLEPLPYAQDALAPHISARTMSLHYGRHHAGYVKKLNAATKDSPKLRAMSLEHLVRDQPRGSRIYNCAAQAWNHTFYWRSMKPDGGGAPSGRLLSMVDAKWGSVDEFKAEFSKLGGGLFGSGWCWLVLSPQRELEIVTTHDADNPIRTGDGTPLLTLDVWEHAYYVDYGPDRAQYITSWWALVNWDFAAENLEHALSASS